MFLNSWTNKQLLVTCIFLDYIRFNVFLLNQYQCKLVKKKALNINDHTAKYFKKYRTNTVTNMLMYEIRCNKTTRKQLILQKEQREM